MFSTLVLDPGITLRCYTDTRFKQGALSLQPVRPMCREEAALNALLPAVLLRGCRDYPDLRDITWRLDELYGASVGTLVRRVGDYQTAGVYCSFMDDRFALPGDAVFTPLMELLQQLLFAPALEQGVFRKDYVESEKKNLLSAIAAQRNDKRAYATDRLLRQMCREDSFGIPRLGEPEQVEAITPDSLYAHYKKIFRESPLELFYVGSQPVEAVAQAVRELLAPLQRGFVPLPPQTALRSGTGGEETEEMAVSQGKLAMGFTTPVTVRSADFAAMQVLNAVFGGGMTSKLFMQIREAQSLCYDIGSGYHSAKGIVVVSAGIDCSSREAVQQEVLHQLEACARGEITDQELQSAKQSLRAALEATHDSPGSIENYYATAALSGLTLTPEAYIRALEAVTVPQLATLAGQLQLHSVFFLKGVAA